jgi:hypothetical protein
LADGRYLLLAHRTSDEVTRYLLFTFDPATRHVAQLSVTSDLPDSRTCVLWTPVIDRERRVAYLLSQVTGANRVGLYRVTLDTGELTESIATTALDPAYSLSGAAVALLQDGRLLVTGGSEDGSNFAPVKRTLLLVPGAAGSVPSLLAEVGVGGMLTLSWKSAAGLFTVEASADLANWMPVEVASATVDALQVLNVNATETARFFRLRRAQP